MRFNINHTVKVKLTPHGLKVLRDQHADESLWQSHNAFRAAAV